MKIFVSWVQSRFSFTISKRLFERLLVIKESKNFGNWKSVGGIEVAVLRKQMESLQTILLSMKKTPEDFHDIVLYLEKIHRHLYKLSL